MELRVLLSQDSLMPIITALVGLLIIGVLFLLPVLRKERTSSTIADGTENNCVFYYSPFIPTHLDPEEDDLFPLVIAITSDCSGDFLRAAGWKPIKMYREKVDCLPGYSPGLTVRTTKKYSMEMEVMRSGNSILSHDALCAENKYVPQGLTVDGRNVDYVPDLACMVPGDERPMYLRSPQLSESSVAYLVQVTNWENEIELLSKRWSPVKVYNRMSDLPQINATDHDSDKLSSATKSTAIDRGLRKVRADLLYKKLKMKNTPVNSAKVTDVGDRLGSASSCSENSDDNKSDGCTLEEVSSSDFVPSTMY